MLSDVMEDYLKAIYVLQSEDGPPVSTSAIAERVGKTPPTVTSMLDTLEERGLVEREKYKGVRLTDEGIINAREALQTYCIIERFLANVLDVEDFRGEARELEAVIDDTVAERLDTIIDRNPNCPDCFDAETDACAELDVESETTAD